VPSFKLVCCWHIVLAYRRVLLPLAACWQASSVLIRFVRYSQLAVTVNNALERLLQNSLTEMYEFFCTLITQRVQVGSCSCKEYTQIGEHSVEFASYAYCFCCFKFCIRITSLWSSGLTSSHGPYLFPVFIARRLFYQASCKQASFTL